MKIKALYPNTFNGTGISYTCISFASVFSNLGVETEAYGIAAQKGYAHPQYIPAIPNYLRGIYYRVCKNDQLKRISEKLYLKDIDSSDIAYLWPGISIETVKAVKAKGCTIITEFTGVHCATARKIYEKEISRLNIQLSNPIGLELIAYDEERISLSDFVVSPSPMVKKSLVENGVPKAKIIESSYGWSQVRQSLISSGPRKSAPLSFLFVGRVQMEKGLYILA